MNNARFQKALRLAMANVVVADIQNPYSQETADAIKEYLRVFFVCVLVYAYRSKRREDRVKIRPETKGDQFAYRLTLAMVDLKYNRERFPENTYEMASMFEMIGEDIAKDLAEGGISRQGVAKQLRLAAEDVGKICVK